MDTGRRKTTGRAALERQDDEHVLRREIKAWKIDIYAKQNELITEDGLLAVWYDMDLPEEKNTISSLVTHQIYMLWKLIHPQFVGVPDFRIRTAI